MEAVTLYQFELCPFCHKVKAALDIKGIPYNKVEVNPMTKKELPELDSNERRKVPVLKIGEELISDSTAILAHLESLDNSVLHHSKIGCPSNDSGGSGRIAPLPVDDCRKNLRQVVVDPILYHDGLGKLWLLR